MNVLVVVVESLRADALGCYAGRARTPNIDALAARSAVFDNAHLSSYACMPARRDLLTGRFEFPFRGWGPMQPEEPSLSALLRHRSVQTVLASDNRCYFRPDAGRYLFDWDGLLLARQQRSMNAEHYQHARRLTTQVFLQVIDYVKSVGRSRRWFVLIDSAAVYESWVLPTTGTAASPAGVGLLRTAAMDEQTNRRLQRARTAYRRALAMFDRWLGRLLAVLDEMELLSETAVLLLSDHGVLLGEHGLVGLPGFAPLGSEPDDNLYEPLSRIPLVFYHPRLASPRRIGALAQTVDVFATVCELFGIDPLIGAHGRSLVPVLAEPQRHLRAVACYGCYGQSLNITDGRYCYFHGVPAHRREEPMVWLGAEKPEFVAYRDCRVEPDERNGWRLYAGRRHAQPSALYDLHDDPAQQRNIIELAPEQANRLRNKLGSFLREIGAPRPLLRRYEL